VVVVVDRKAATLVSVRGCICRKWVHIVLAGSFHGFLCLKSPQQQCDKINLRCTAGQARRRRDKATGGGSGSSGGGKVQGPAQSLKTRRIHGASWKNDPLVKAGPGGWEEAGGRGRGWEGTGPRGWTDVGQVTVGWDLRGCVKFHTAACQVQTNNLNPVQQVAMPTPHHLHPCSHPSCSQDRLRLERLLRQRTREDHHAAFQAYLAEMEAHLQRSLQVLACTESAL